MKKLTPCLRMPVLAAISLAAMIWPAPKDAAAKAKAKPQTYQLYCRGGGDNQLYVKAVTSEHTDYAEWYDLFGDDSTSVQAFMYAKYWFKKGTSRYSNNLEPGQCTWIDRGLNGREPNLITIGTKLGGNGAELAFLSKGGKLRGIFGSVPNIKFSKDGVVESQKRIDTLEMQALGALLDSNKVVVMDVYNNKGKNLATTKVTQIFELVRTGPKG